MSEKEEMTNRREMEKRKSEGKELEDTEEKKENKCLFLYPIRVLGLNGSDVLSVHISKLFSGFLLEWLFDLGFHVE